VKIAFWCSLCCILYTYAGYPVIMWMLARLRPRRWKIAPITPGISIVLAVHDGVALLPQKIEHLLALDYPNIQEIIIVSDGSTDGTAELLAENHAPRLFPIILKEHAGKAVALNAGVRQAHADVVLFVDIRPEIAQGAIQHLVSNFADPKVGCVAGELILRQGSREGVTGAVGGLYWRYEQWIRTCEAVSDSTVGVYGGFYAIRRELAVEQPAGMILDDVFQPLSIIRQGYRSVLDSSAYVYDTWPESVQGEFHRKVRTLAGNFQLFQCAAWTLSPQNRVLFQLVSHKAMRLVSPYVLVLCILSTLALSVHSPIYAALGAVQVLTLGIAVAGLRFRVPVLHHLAAPASGLLMLNAAAVVGLHRFLFTRGPLWKIWNAGKPRATAAAARERVDETAQKPVAIATAINSGTTLRIHPNRH
jgi:poly-beta-1,6-N-acetyl-D-glucosamine synthase